MDKTIERFLNRLEFPAAHIVEGRSSIADLFKPNQRCGIYILYFANQEYYCGKTVDITHRYVQHRKTHQDIVAIRFKCIEQDFLGQEEVRCIHALDAEGFKLRNISLTSIPYGETDFDLVMTPEGQQRWRNDLHFCDIEGPRIQNEVLRRKYHQKYLNLTKEPDFERVIEVLRVYAQTCLPALKRGEMSFWSSSCLPGNRRKGITVYSRINIFWQEVFTVVRDSSREKIDFHFHVAKSPLEGNPLSHWVRSMRLPTLEKWDHKYVPGGQDQVSLLVEGCEEAMKLLADTKVRTAIRLFNLRLMQKGACIFNRNHCLDLADRLVEQ